MRSIAILIAFAILLFVSSEEAVAAHNDNLVKSGVVTVEATPCRDHTLESLSVSRAIKQQRGEAQHEHQ